MGVLEQITDLKTSGLTEQQIVNKLQEEGISPKEINDALNRSKIKTAVSDKGQVAEGMQPSIMEPKEDMPLPPSPSAQQTQKSFAPQTQELNQTQQYQEKVYNPMPQYEQYPQEEYYGGATDTDTKIEIAEQVFSEKMRDSQKKIDEILEFKTLADVKIENISERLKRIESQIDNLQASILEKVGSYGRGLDVVKKEMKMVEDSFGKVVNDLVSKRTKHRTKHKPKTVTVHKSKKRSKKISRRK